MSTGEWELFKQVGAKLKSRASISASGAISFTRGAMLQFKIDKDHHKYARLYYNATAKKIGIAFTAQDGDYTVKTNFRGDTGFWFSGKTFLTFFEIMPKTTGLYEIEKDAENDMLVIDLNTRHERKKAKTIDKNTEQLTGEPTIRRLF